MVCRTGLSPRRYQPTSIQTRFGPGGLLSVGELEALFTWARHFLPDEAGILPFRDLRTALTTRLHTQWDIHMVPSDLEFRYANLQGDVFPTGPSYNF